MSRTFVHRPVRVQERDRRFRGWFRDFHHHGDGVCDFDDYMVRGWQLGQRCWRRLWTSAPRLCGCRLCVDQPGRKVRRRRERVVLRAAVRDVVKTGPDNWWDIDIVEPHRSIDL